MYLLLVETGTAQKCFEIKVRRYNMFSISYSVPIIVPTLHLYMRITKFYYFLAE